MANLQVNGTSLSFLEGGSGLPVLLVHGSAGDRRTWKHQLDGLSGALRVITYSRRYHWPNVKIEDGYEYNLAEQVHDLEQVLHELGVAPVHLVGHSYGALICLQLAMQAPALVRSMVLAEPPIMTLLVDVPPKPAEIFRLLLRSPKTAIGIMKLGALGMEPAKAAFLRGDLDKAMEKLGQGILGKHHFKNLSQERKAQVRDNLIKEELLSEGFLPRFNPDTVVNVSHPVLLVEGTDSPRVMHQLLNHLEKLLPNVQRIAIKNASHIMHEDIPVDYNQAILRFVMETEK
ncbi:MAG: alpha/beta hydrolase [Saprospiraceae bacterium]|nr:alpha/beta hydrolase [Saprospiraceae bacterium]